MFAGRVKTYKGMWSRLLGAIRSTRSDVGSLQAALGSEEKVHSAQLYLDIFFTLCDWLEIPPDKFIKNTEDLEERETFGSICTLLRSDKRLNRDIAEALAVLIEAAYLKQI